MRARSKKKNRPSTLPLRKTQLVSIPLLPFILTYLDLTEWVNVVAVNQLFHNLLVDQCNDLRHLKVLRHLKQLRASQETLLLPLDQIFKDLEGKLLSLQVKTLKAAIYYLQNSTYFIPTQRLLSTSNPLRLYSNEIVAVKKTEETSTEDILFFNNVVREILSLYFNFLKTTGCENFQDLFLTKLKEKYLQLKYSIRDSNPPNKTENDFSDAINIYINLAADEAHHDAKKNKARLPVVNLTALTLITLNFLLAIYRITNSPRDTKSIFYQAIGLAILSLVIVCGVEVFYENKSDHRESQGTRLKLFSKHRKREQIKRINELATLLPGTDPVSTPSAMIS